MDWNRIAKSIARHYGLRLSQVMAGAEWAISAHYDPRTLGKAFWENAQKAWITGNDACCW